MSTDAMHASVTFLTWDQLIAGLVASSDEYDRRFTAYLAASTVEIDRAAAGLDRTEAHADAEYRWSACKAQSAMTQNIIAEIRVRQLRKDYGPTATETPGE